MAELAEAKGNGVNATPTFFLGIRDATPDRIHVVSRVDGFESASVFQRALDALLSAAQTAN